MAIEFSELDPPVDKTGPGHDNDHPALLDGGWSWTPDSPSLQLR